MEMTNLTAQNGYLPESTVVKDQDRCFNKVSILPNHQVFNFDIDLLIEKMELLMVKFDEVFND